MIGNRPVWDAEAAQRKSRKIKSAVRVAFVLAVLSGCVSYESAYEKAVYNEEPVYCYQSIGTVDCYRKPDRRSDARLVNYYGPAPAKTRPKKPPPAVELQPPPAPEDEAVAESATASEVEPAQEKALGTDDRAGDTTWKRWLPFISLGFGALQVIAAFVL